MCLINRVTAEVKYWEQSYRFGDKSGRFAGDGVTSRQMIDKKNAGTEPWYRASARNKVIFAVVYLWPIFPIVLFLRRIHISTVIICSLIGPWVLFGLAMVVRPNWVERMRRVWERELERVGEGLERRPPTGLP